MENLMGLNIHLDKRLNCPAGFEDEIPMNREIWQIES